jgi:hypothetical protein
VSKEEGREEQKVVEKSCTHMQLHAPCWIDDDA